MTSDHTELYEFDLFGAAVAVSDRYALVGAPGSVFEGSWGGGGATVGRAYLFDVETGERLLKFEPNDLSPGSLFGCKVALSDKYALIGASRDHVKGLNSGSAYLFDLVTGQQVYKFTPDNDSERSYFGSSVALSQSQVLIGAVEPLNFQNETIGHAYLFDLETKEQLYKFSANTDAGYSSFGCSVALSNDSALIGAAREDLNVERHSGSVYHYSLVSPEAGVSQEVLLSQSEIVEGNEIGSIVGSLSFCLLYTSPSPRDA